MIITVIHFSNHNQIQTFLFHVVNVINSTFFKMLRGIKVHYELLFIINLFIFCIFYYK